MCSATVPLTIQWRLPFGARGDDHPRPPEDSDDEDGGAAGPPEAGAPGPVGGMFPEIQARPLRPLAAVAEPRTSIIYTAGETSTYLILVYD